MEHIGHSHAILPENVSRISSFIAVQNMPPKTRCNHCCLRQYVPHPSDEQQHSAMGACNGNFCTQTCFSSLQRISRVPTQAPVSCNCHTPQAIHPYTQRQVPVTPSVISGCPCCHQQQAPSRTEHHHRYVSRPHMATNNLTYPTPHYATSYVRNPGLHHSWEPTTGYRETEFHMHMESGTSSSQLHSHIHHHRNQHYTNPVCADRSPFRDQSSLYTFASRPYRRHVSRIASHPYSLHHPFDPMYHYQTYPSVTPVLAAGSYLFPTRPLLPTPLDFISSELDEAESLTAWEEMTGRHAEPVGLRKDQLNKLPSYVVTKKTMEEFTENEKCVVCMCEFDIDDRLRILPCAHEFHLDCIDKWIQGNPTCPICRAIVDVT